MKPNRFASPITALTSIVLVVSAVSSAHAAPISWSGATNTTWATGSNWGGIAPVNDLFTDIADFNLASYANQPNAGTTSINGITIGASSAGLTLGADNLTLGAGGITVAAGASASTISGPITLGGPQTWTNNSANLFTVGSIGRSAGASVNFSTGAGGIQTSNTATNGILGGWATLGNSGASGATADWATVDGSGNISAYTAYTAVGTLLANTHYTLDGTTVSQNWKAGKSDGNSNAAAGYKTYVDNTGTINSLSAQGDVSITSGATLTLGSGGLILNGVSRWILNNDAGTSAGTGQLTSGSSQLFIDVASSNANANSWRIWTKIVDNGAAVNVIKNGPGYVDFSNANTYTGNTYLSSGTLAAAVTNAFGTTGALYLSGGTLTDGNATANVDLPNNIVVAGSSAIQLGIAKNFSLNGGISGSGSLTLGNNNLNSSVYINGANTMTGGTVTIANNTNSVRFTTAAAGNANVSWVLNNAGANKNTIDFPDGGTISFGSMTGTGLLQGNGSGNRTISVGALGLNDTFSGVIANGSGITAITKVGAGKLILSGADSYTGATTVNGGTLQIGNGTTGSLAGGSAVTIGTSGTLALNLAAAGTFANTITNTGNISAGSANATTLSGTISGTGSLQKSGAGILTVTGTNDYSGPTTVTAGTLLVTGSIAGSATTLGAATLGGNGSVGGVTVSNSAAIITNGVSSTGTLYLDSLKFTTGATLNLNKANDTFTPALAITGNLTATAGITVNLTTAPSLANGTYDLITYGGSFIGAAGNFVKGTIPGLGGRQSATIVDTGSSIALAIAGDSPYWTGAKDSTWTTSIVAAPKNWKLVTANTTTDFQANDQVLFNDNATGSTAVNISTANVKVAGVTFDNYALNYTVSSSGGFGIADSTTSASLTKNGDATVTLATTNSFTGQTSITAGTLSLGDGTTNGDIATSSSIVNNGTLEFNRSSGSFTYSHPISGYGTVTKNGAGTQILDGTNAMTGILTINAGTLQIGSGGTTGSLGSAAITNNASLVFNRTDVIQGADVGPIDGTGSVTQSGSGTLTMTAFSSYSGGTNLNSGTIAVGSTSPLGTGPVSLNGGTLASSTTADSTLANAVTAQASTTLLVTNGKNITLSGTLGGSGNISRNATGGAASVFLSGDNSGFTGTFTVENNGNAATRFTSATSGSANAKWVINQPTSTRASVDSPGGTIQMGSLTGTGFITAQGTGTTTLQVGNLGIDETFPGVLNQLSGTTILAVTKVGTGTWTLTGTNTYTGDTAVNAGVLAVDGDAIANTNKLVINGGKVNPMGATEVVNTLFFGATQQAAGTWGATASGATHIDDIHFTGTGMVSVTSAPAGDYAAWAAANAPGQTKDQDYDNDGVSNGIEYFMGLSGSGFTANPAPASGAVTWPMGASYTGVYGTDYEVQTSADLVTWTQVPVGTGDNTVAVTAGTSVVYDMPTGGKSFVRLVVRN